MALSGLAHADTQYLWRTIELDGYPTISDSFKAGEGIMLVGGEGGEGLVLYSEDGCEWDRRGGSLPGDPYLVHGLYAEGIVIAAARADGLYYSTDLGKNWSIANIDESSLNDDFRPEVVIHHSGHFLAYGETHGPDGQEGAKAVSVDGINWVADSDFPRPSGFWNMSSAPWGVVYINRSDSGGSVIYASEDGLDWPEDPLVEGEQDYYVFVDAAVFEDQLLVSGYQGMAGVQRTWVAAYDENGNRNEWASFDGFFAVPLLSNNEGLLTIEDNNVVYISDNGREWQQVDYPGPQNRQRHFIVHQTRLIGYELSGFDRDEILIGEPAGTFPVPTLNLRAYWLLAVLMLVIGISAVARSAVR